MNPRLSIVLPCYNESGTIPQLFARFDELVTSDTGLEVIFVNNGSRDGSAAIFATELSRPGRQWARLITVPENKGYGHGILAGLREARGAYLGWTHADSQYDPRHVLDGFRLLVGGDSKHFLVQGRRRGRSLFDSFFTASMTVVARALLRVDVCDVNAQPKLFPRALLDEMKSSPDDFSLDLYLLVLARQCGYTTLFIPVDFLPRLHGDAKGGGSIRLKWKLTKRTWAYMLQLRRNLRAGQK